MVIVVMHCKNYFNDYCDYHKESSVSRYVVMITDMLYAIHHSWQYRSVLSCKVIALVEREWAHCLPPHSAWVDEIIQMQCWVVLCNGVFCFVLFFVCSCIFVCVCFVFYVFIF